MSSDTERSVLQGSWHALATAARESMASLPLSEQASSGSRIALDLDGSRHLLAPTRLPLRSWGQVDSPLKDSVRTLAFGGSSDTYLDLRCTDPSLFSIFDELILDVVESTAGIDDCGAAIDAALAQWRSMFRAVAMVSFGRDQRFGLFAELLVLESCVSLVGPSALASWTGPLGKPHDFELPYGCLEVKAVGVASRAVTIHGFAQLEPDRSVPLQLLVFTLAESAEGRTLSELVEAIETVTGHGTLEPQLTALGYSGSRPDERLGVLEGVVVTVDDRLPQLSATTVLQSARGGISRVEYEIPMACLQSLSNGLTTSSAISGALL